jgi:hypothetical protein
MNTITEFLNKWGLTILVVIALMTTISTCGVKGKIERLDKKVQKLETTLNYNDSINDVKNKIEIEIYNLKVERSVLHNMNEIVLKNIRPAERISEINDQIDKLNKQLKQ